MKKSRYTGGYVFVSLAILTSFQAFPALGATAFIEKKFSNCSELNAVYPGGVAKNTKAQNKGGATEYSPVVKPKVYKLNSSKDRDRDGIACER